MKAQTKILIVDDAPANVRLIERVLKRENFLTLSAKDGLEGLELAQKEGPDLILLDIMMPEMDGYEVCRRLKANEATKAIPVIFVSALAEIKNRIEGLKVGAVDYITKPIKRNDLVERVITQLIVVGKY